MNAPAKVRCAIYTRKSNEEGLEQEFNSLDAQRDACERYIASQRGEGWVLVPTHYDDGGFTGGNTERPALKELFADIKDGLIDVVVVYKIDRLSRSMLDFLTMVKTFDAHNVSFVSITQQFNTSTPMGKLMMNVLMSFGEYEREITGERIRDKITSSKQKGIWMGGTPPLGYDVISRKLIINESEAGTVRTIFREMARHHSLTTLLQQLKRDGARGKRWVTQKGEKRENKPLSKTTVYKMLRNPIYIGRLRHKKDSYPGEHLPIISQELWDKVQASLDSKIPGKPAPRYDTKNPHLLRGILFDVTGCALTPSHTTNRRGQYYRYYVSTRAIKEGYGSVRLPSLPANQIEEIIITQIRDMLVCPEMIFKTYQRARELAVGVEIEDIRSAFEQFNEVWQQLFPVEQNRLVKLLIKRIDITETGMHISYQANGLVQLCEELKSYGSAA